VSPAGTLPGTAGPGGDATASLAAGVDDAGERLDEPRGREGAKADAKDFETF
jgi:hypothetical protein